MLNAIRSELYALNPAKSADRRIAAVIIEQIVDLGNETLISTIYAESVKIAVSLGLIKTPSKEGVTYA